MIGLLISMPKSEQPNAMQALAERGDTTAIQGPFEEGSTVPVFHPVKVLDRGDIDPRGRLSWCKVLYEVYPYTDPPTYELQPLYVVASNDEWYWRDSLAYAFSRTMRSRTHGVDQVQFLIDGSVGRHMLMQKEAVVYGGQHKRSAEPY